MRPVNGRSSAVVLSKFTAASCVISCATTVISPRTMVGVLFCRQAVVSSPLESSHEPAPASPVLVRWPRGDHEPAPALTGAVPQITAGRTPSLARSVLTGEFGQLALVGVEVCHLGQRLPRRRHILAQRGAINCWRSGDGLFRTDAAPAQTALRTVVRNDRGVVMGR